jgi:flagellar biosynthesis/type III secretory pathway chaperone
MINELIKLMLDQEKHLKKLSELLDIQYDMIMKKDLFGLEGLIDKLNECSKIIAKEELERRKLLGENSISETVNKSNNTELKQSYKNIRDTLKSVLSKKETNEMLLKQKILFNTKMLNIMSPNRSIKTYNSYGNLSR